MSSQVGIAPEANKLGSEWSNSIDINPLSKGWLPSARGCENIQKKAEDVGLRLRDSGFASARRLTQPTSLVVSNSGQGP